MSEKDELEIREEPLSDNPLEDPPEEEKIETEQRTEELPKEEKIIPEQGIDTEKYEVSEPWLNGERVEDEKSGIPIAYDLEPEEVQKGLKYFQKKTIYKKNTIFTVILAIIVLLYAQAVITDPGYALGYILGFLALAVIFFMWYLPARHIKSTVQATKIVKDIFHLEICEEGLLMPQSDGKFLLGFENPAVTATEFPDLFLLIASKEKLFVLPKRCIPEENLEPVRELLKNGLGGRYTFVSEEGKK